MNRVLHIFLTDGGDRQTLPLAKIYKKMGHHVTTLNGSKLDVGYSSKYPDRKLIFPEILHNKPKHIKVIRECLNTGDYDVAITTSDDTAEGLSLMKSDLEGKVHIAVVSPDLFYKAYDKNNTMKICMDSGIPCPTSYFDIHNQNELLAREISYPIVIKPRKGYGAIGYHKVDSEEELKIITDNLGSDLQNYVIQEYIPQTDIQYECAVFMDNENNAKTACVFSKNRWFPIKGGSSTCNVTVNRPDITESCIKLLKLMNWRGPADIDLIQDPRDGKAKIMEVNPRLSGSIKVVLNAGVNIAEQIVQLAMCEQVTSYLEYKTDVRMRCLHTDFLWFLQSPNRFHSKPSWFSWKNTSDQIFDFGDMLPFFTFTVQSLGKYKKEMEKRK